MGYSVAIFGAGVSGLTAAHELSQRGFDVTVYDAAPEYTAAQHPKLAGRSPVGGKARTQWKYDSTWFKDPDNPAIPMLLPGEHGFRFFPSFYRHLTHTMRRIPALDRGATSPRPPYRSVADNLQPVLEQGIAIRGDFSVLTVDRTLPRSMEAVTRGAVKKLLRFKYSMRDILRFQLKLFEFMTSCEERRLNDYEKQSWWDFLHGDKYSPRFQRHLQSVPRALVAMDAKNCDGRTQGNVLIQLFLDQFSVGSETDRTLNGPTSDQWLDHWYVFLRDQQRVKFEFGKKVSHFTFDNSGLAAYLGDDAQPPNLTEIRANYFVLALPLDLADGVIQESQAKSPGFLEADAFEMNYRNTLVNLDALRGKDPMALLSGVQFYLDRDIGILPGHIYFPDSEYGLSAVSQAQFWGGDFERLYGPGLRGILSVDIADWETPSQSGVAARDQPSLAALADEIWRQISDALKPGDIIWPTPMVAGMPYRDVHFDDGIFNAAPPAVLPNPPNPPRWSNNSRMFITPPDSWSLRPGPVDPLLPPEQQTGYAVRFKRLVLAGDYAQTFTGLPTMEAANESARHAVNGILAHVEAGLTEESVSRTPTPTTMIPPALERCPLFRLTDYEPGDLTVLKEMDAKLYAKGDPHFVEILGLEDLIDSMLAKEVDNSGAPYVDPADVFNDVLSSQLGAVNSLLKMI